MYGVDTCVEIQKNFRVGSNSKIYTFMGFKSIIHMKKGIDVISQSLVAKSEIYIFKDSPKNIILFKWKLLLLSSFYFIKNKSRQVLRQVFIEIHGINTKKNQYFIRNPNYYYFMIYEDTFPSCITKYFNDMESIFPCAVDVQRNVIIEKCNLRITFVGFNRLELAISGMEIFKNFLTFREVKLFNKKANLHYINISENLVSPAILTQLFYFIKTFLPVRDIQRNVLYKSERISTLFGFDDLFITFVSFHKIEEFLSDQGYGDNDCDYKMNIFENQIFETSSDFEKAIEGIKYSSIQRNVTTFLENSQKFRNYQMLSTLINFDSNNEKNNALTKLNLRLFNNHAFTPKEDLYYCYFYEHKFSDIHPDHIEFVLEEFQGIKDFQRNVRSIENPYSATFIGFDDQQDAIDGLKDIKMTLKLAKFKKSESLEKRVNSRLPEFQKSKSIIWFRRFIILLLLSKLYFLYR
ncbi:hypothetical protein TRFO_26505 [Tritrichomonas foetus]|uniref:Uncharacterized protein n=1 Tax=Tritrichomonas foetus TaxID=1144522 RepID=A0A1J4K3I9_9EUKA|nr:hypothetical protein TRFO_26505 [Tritrichomonas foetus]|eukprot:OHT05747.1 hypothetical protein TRFO_26505 [Tritrichomonas foetus]